MSQHIHELKADSFDLTPPWQPIATLPRDGHRFEVQDRYGNVWLGRWDGDRIVVDSDQLVELTSWRPV